jgi:hypothetical protein
VAVEKHDFCSNLARFFRNVIALRPIGNKIFFKKEACSRALGLMANHNVFESSNIWHWEKYEPLSFLLTAP